MLHLLYNSIRARTLHSDTIRADLIFAGIRASHQFAYQSPLPSVKTIRLTTSTRNSSGPFSPVSPSPRRYLFTTLAEKLSTILSSRRMSSSVANGLKELNTRPETEWPELISDANAVYTLEWKLTNEKRKASDDAPEGKRVLFGHPLEQWSNDVVSPKGTLDLVKSKLETSSNFLIEENDDNDESDVESDQNAKGKKGLESDLHLVSKLANASRHLVRESESEYPYFSFFSLNNVSLNTFKAQHFLAGNLKVHSDFLNSAKEIHAASNETITDFITRVIFDSAYALDNHEVDFDLLSALLQDLSHLRVIRVGQEEINPCFEFVIGSTKSGNTAGVMTGVVMT